MKPMVVLPDANPLSSRAQNRGFCALLGFGTLVFGLSEHKIGVFVRFLPSEPPFSGILSTKTACLCQKRRYFPGFGSSRAQNRHFCALLSASFFPMAPPASNKLHPAEKSTLVWLAIWHIWAGFANSQHRDAAFRCTY